MQQILNTVERKESKMVQKKNKFTVEDIVKFLRDEEENETIEGQLLRTKMILELYKQLCDPKEEDFKEEMEPAGTYWSKETGYTTSIEVMTAERMEYCNRQETNWQITYPSQTKRQIVEEYKEKGWTCDVGPYVVSCMKFVKHPKYEGIWVCFRSTRDCNKYQYIIEK